MIASEWLDPAIASRVFITLLHSLWQVTVVAVLVALSIRHCRLRPQIGYFVSVAALFVSLALIPCTFHLLKRDRVVFATEVPGSVSTIQSIDLWNDDLGLGRSTLPHAFAMNQTVTRPSDKKSVQQASFPDDLATPKWQAFTSIAIILYLAGVAWMTIRLVMMVWRANRLGRAATVITHGTAFDLLQRTTSTWSMRISPRLAIAEQAVMPKVVGLLRPTILLPASALVGMPADELEMVLAHELAHVRRHDMWVNLFQRLAEVVLFFNPAVWYLSRQISCQREYCCDEMACEILGKRQPRTRYALALLHVVELVGVGDSSDSNQLAALAASGQSPSELRRRVARLLGEPVNEPLRFPRWSLVAIIVAVLMVVARPAVWQAGAQNNDSGATFVAPVERETVVPGKDEAVRLEGANQQVVSSDGAPPLDRFPGATATRSSARRGDRSAVWFHSRDHVHFVVYYAGFLQTGIENSQPAVSETNLVSPRERAELEEAYRDFRLHSDLVWNSEGELVNPHRERTLVLVQKISALREKIRKNEIALSSARSVAKVAKEKSSDPQVVLRILEELSVPQASNQAYKDRLARESLAAVVEMKRQIQPLRVERNKYAEEYGENHPVIKKLDSDLALIEKRLLDIFPAQEQPLADSSVEMDQPRVDPRATKALDAQLVPLIIERNKFEAEFGINHPTVRALDAELETIHKELARVRGDAKKTVEQETWKRVDSQIASLESMASQLEKQMATLEQQFATEKASLKTYAEYEKKDLEFRRGLGATYWQLRGVVNAFPPEFTSANDERHQVKIEFAQRGNGLRLSLDGRSFELAAGRVFIIGGSGDEFALKQIPIDPPALKDRDNLDELASRIDAELAKPRD